MSEASKNLVAHGLMFKLTEPQRDRWRQRRALRAPAGTTMTVLLPYTNRDHYAVLKPRQGLRLPEVLMQAATPWVGPQRIAYHLALENLGLALPYNQLPLLGELTDQANGVTYLIYGVSNDWQTPDHTYKSQMPRRTPLPKLDVLDPYWLKQKLEEDLLGPTATFIFSAQPNLGYGWPTRQCEA